MLEDEACQKQKLEGEIAMLQSRLLQISFDTDEVCFIEIISSKKDPPILSTKGPGSLLDCDVDSKISFSFGYHSNYLLWCQ